jgi:DNA-binding beta-propeller fold protein YncE
MRLTPRSHRRTLGRVVVAACALAATSACAHTVATTGMPPSRRDSGGAPSARMAPSPVLQVIRVAAHPSALVVDAATERVFVFSSVAHESSIGVLDARTGRSLHTLRLGQQAFIPSTNGLPAAIDTRTRQVFVPTSQQADVTASPHGAGHVWVLDGRTGAVRRVVPVGYAPQAVSIDTRTRRVLVCNGVRTDAYGAPLGDGTLSALDAGTGAVVRTVPHVGCAALAVDERTGRAFALGSAVLVLDAATGAVRAQVPLSPPGNQDRQGGTGIAVDVRAGRVLVGLSDALGLTDGRILDATTGAVLADAPDLGGPMAVDEGIGRAVVVGVPTSSTGGPIDVATVATRTGHAVRVVTVGRSTAVGVAAAVAVDTRTHRAFVVTQVPPSLTPTRDVLTAIDTRTGQPGRALALGTGPPAVAVDEQTGRMFVANAGDSTVSMLDTTRL